MNETVRRLMEGAYDVHFHAAPCLSNRRQTIFEVARDARDAGMKGLVVKDHYFSTAPLAMATKEVVPEVNVIGGITLNESVGGLNPAAVETTFKLGGRVVWMFSLESAWMLRQISSPDFKSSETYKKLGVKPGQQGYTILLESGGLKEEAKEIVSLCKQYDAVLETSHLSPDECYAIIKEARQQGLRRIVVTHANQDVTLYAVQAQQELISMGANMMYCMFSYLSKPGEPGKDVKDLGRLIRSVGAGNIVLGTDFGLFYLPPAVEGIRMMIATLVDQGFSEEDIKMMVSTNPDNIYGI